MFVNKEIKQGFLYAPEQNVHSFMWDIHFVSYFHELCRHFKVQGMCYKNLANSCPYSENLCDQLLTHDLYSENFCKEKTKMITLSSTKLVATHLYLKTLTLHTQSEHKCINSNHT